jgi:hypothetical protein
MKLNANTTIDTTICTDTEISFVYLTHRNIQYMVKFSNDKIFLHKSDNADKIAEFDPATGISLGYHTSRDGTKLFLNPVNIAGFLECNAHGSSEYSEGLYNLLTKELLDYKHRIDSRMPTE